MGTRALSRALTMSVAVTVSSVVGVTTPASADPAPGVTLVAASTTTWFGQIEWHAGSVYSVRDNDEIVTFPADGSAPTIPASTTAIPLAWHGDGHWQSDREAFVVAGDGSVYLRSPDLDHAAGGSPSTHGWGIGRLDVDGSVSPVIPPPGGSLGGSSESLVMDPNGDGVYLGGQRPGSASEYSYGVVARLPLPAAGDQQAAAEIVVSADSFTGSAESYHVTPFLAVDHIHAATQAFISNPPVAEVKGKQLYFNNQYHAIERVDLVGGDIQTVAGRPFAGDPTQPEEGMLATTPYITVQAGPVVDRAGNIFFAEGSPSRFSPEPGVIWKVRASDGTLHRVAGGGSDADAQTGDDPLSLVLYAADLELDPDGNLYVSSSNNSQGQRSIIRINGVAAADTVPGAATGLTAESGDQSLVVSWQPPVDDGGQPVTSYTVRLHSPGGGDDVVRHVTTLTTTFAGLLNDAPYDVSVRATNGRGDGPDATVTGSPADFQASLTAVAPGTAPYAVSLDASGSRAPVGATYQFFCGDRDTPNGAPSTTATASCTYSRGSTPAGWPARVVMRNPATGKSYESTRPVVVADQPDTIEGSSGFPTDHLVVDVPAASDGSLTSASCGAGSTGATCVTVDGARIVLTAAPGTFSPSSHVRIYRGDASALQSELGSDVQVQNGFAITWTPKVDLTQPLLVNISPAGVGRQRGSFDVGGFFSGMAQTLSSTAATVANTVGSAVSAAANAVSSAAASLWAAATQNLVRPNNSATNDVIMCNGEWRSTLSTGWECSDRVFILRGVHTERITTLDAGSGVVAAGGANVVAAGGANAVAAGGLNLVPVAEPGQLFHLDAHSVVASGGLNVVAPGGANIISDNGLGVVAAGGANVVAAGGLNLTAIAVRDPGFAVVTPSDPAAPTVAATVEPAPPASGIYPYGTTVLVHVSAAAAGDKSVQNVHAETTGAQLIPHTVVAGSSASVQVSSSGTTTVGYGATDDQLAESAPGTIEVRIAAPAPPGQPTAVTGVAPDRHSVEVSWTGPGNHGDLPLTGYRVTLTDLGVIGTGSGAAGPRTADVTATTAGFTGLDAGHRYVATVVARSGAGDSPASVPTAPVATAFAPQAPSGLVATAGDASVSLSWSAPLDDGGTPVTSYVVQRATVAGGAFSTVGSPTAASFVDGSATNGSTYYYVVRALNAIGGSGPSTATSAAPSHVRVAQTLTFAQPGDRTYGAGDGQLQAASSSGLPVSLTSLSTDVCTVSGANVHVLSAGTCRIEGGQPGDVDRLPAAPVMRTFTVAPAPLIVTASGVVMVRKGRTPAVGAVYAGFVAGDDVFDLTAAARCSANTKTKVTSCTGVGSRNYTSSYRSGKVAQSKTGYAIVSLPVVQGRRGAKVTLKVALDGGAASLTSKGGLPPGVKVISNRARTNLTFSGVPTTAGTWRVTVTASAHGKVARQTITFVIA